MKLLARLVEDALERSPLLKQAVTVGAALALEVKNLGEGVTALAHIVQAHHMALQELYARQGMVLKAVQGNSLDMKMPDGKKDEKGSKPN